jgi:hypothetical protein
VTDTQTNPRTKRKPTFYAHLTMSDNRKELITAATRTELASLLNKSGDILSVDLVVKGYPLEAKTEKKVVLQ